ncbi:MAG: DUF1850 domain-containing protein [Syntrophomonadaceae bacterium]|nr:DUF1850 domain-containing protein [Syntrophomonadaceae bacterium]MDD3889920.1 DUF1850 domain-containing protein [Syntrophomonadaceae bacterium]MDD4550117.1 DUF1850 domain-containing protein [Syntrophomonadaceae bacterium]
MGIRSLKWAKIVTWGLVTLFLLVILFLPFPVLVLSTQKGTTVLLVPMVFEKNFTLEYLHSVQKTPVQENLTLAPENKLLLTSTYYQSLGVGLPFLPEEGKLVNDNGIFKLTGLNRLYDKICLGFMPLAKHALLYHGNRYDFKDYFLPGTIIEIEIKKLSPAEILWQASHCEREVNVD